MKFGTERGKRFFSHCILHQVLTHNKGDNHGVEKRDLKNRETERAQEGKNKTATCSQGLEKFKKKKKTHRKGWNPSVF